MKTGWKEYIKYGSIIFFVGLFLYLTYETYKANNMGFETKTYWDWMQLLIIPVVLAIGAFFLQHSERAIERETADKRAELEREIAKDRQQEEALQAYLDRMSELLLKEKLLTTKKAEVCNVARTRTVSIMRVLNMERNDLVIQFLREAKLITDENSILNGADMADMYLEDLDFEHVFLQETDLSGADLRWTNWYEAHLERAILMDTSFKLADLPETNLAEANMLWADLSGADLIGADLSGANLEEADLTGADLAEADLSRADLTGADLTGAFLEEANLKGAKVTDKQLAKAKSLKGATMPDGTEHE